MEKYRTVFKRGQFHLSEEEIIKLISSTKSPRDRVIIELLSFQALRRFEVAKIKIEDIDLDRRTINVLGKKNIFRIASLYSDSLLKHLEIYMSLLKSGETYLFPAVSNLNKEGHISKTQINRIVASAGERAKLKNPTPGLKNINPHILRHSCARILKDKGLSLETVQKVMGHLSFKSTMDVYGVKSVNEVNAELVRKAGLLFK